MKRPETLEKCARALKLREGGMIYRHIGDLFGVTTERARQMVYGGARAAGYPFPIKVIKGKQINVIGR